MVICAILRKFSLSVSLTVILGAMSPPLVIGSSVLFMILEPLYNRQPSRKFKIGVRAGLILSVWFAGSMDLWSRWKAAEETRLDPMAAWVREGFSYMPDACQCPVLSHNSSVPPWEGRPIRVTTPTTRAVDNILAIVTSPETIFALALTAFLKASHEVLALENDL